MRPRHDGWRESAHPGGTSRADESAASSRVPARTQANYAGDAIPDAFPCTVVLMPLRILVTDGIDHDGVALLRAVPEFAVDL